MQNLLKENCSWFSLLVLEVRQNEYVENRKTNGIKLIEKLAGLCLVGRFVVSHWCHQQPLNNSEIGNKHFERPHTRKPLPSVPIVKPVTCRQAVPYIYIVSYKHGSWGMLWEGVLRTLEKNWIFRNQFCSCSHFSDLHWKRLN